MTGLALSPARTLPTVPLPRRARDARPAGQSGDGEPGSPAPAARQLARAQVSERAGTVVIEFWVDASRGPLPLRRLLVAETFAHPAVRPHRPAVVSVPLGDSALLGEVGARLALARTRACGATCLVEGRIRG